MKRNARMRGPTSSQQQNDMADEIAHDLGELNSQWNDRLVPLLDALPNGTEGSSDFVDAFANGLDGKTMFVDSDSTVSEESAYFNAAADRPNTLKEQISAIYSTITAVQEDLQNELSQTFFTADQISINDTAGLFT